MVSDWIFCKKDMDLVLQVSGAEHTLCSAGQFEAFKFTLSEIRPSLEWSGVPSFMDLINDHGSSIRGLAAAHVVAVVSGSWSRIGPLRAGR